MTAAAAPTPSGAAPRLPALLVEAFAAGPLQGNGAAVVGLQQPASAAWMQAVAASLRQSETAFLWQAQPQRWALRWFTPSCEVDLCGHATLAACLALGHWGLLAPDASLTLVSRSGGLRVRHRNGEASLALPSAGLLPQPVPAYLGDLLGVSPLAYWSSALGYRVALLPPDLPLSDLPPLTPQGADRRGLVLMQAAGPHTPDLRGEPSDYQLRFFAPDLGISEDPVTGSAHALVAPWWMEQLGRDRVVGWQCSPRRGGMLCERAQAGYVRLTGTGHLLWDGTLEAGGCGSDFSAWQVCHSG